MMLVLEDTCADVALKRLDVTNAMNGSHVHGQIVFQGKFLAADLTLELSFSMLTVCRVVVSVDR